MLYYIKNYWILNISFYISYMLATYRNIFVTLLRCCSGVLGRAGVDSSVLVLARALSGICSGRAAGSLVRVLGHNRVYSGVPWRTGAYSSVCWYSSVLGRTRTRAHTSVPGRIRAYSGILSRTRAYVRVLRVQPPIAAAMESRPTP